MKDPLTSRGGGGWREALGLRDRLSIGFAPWPAVPEEWTAGDVDETFAQQAARLRPILELSEDEDPIPM